MIEITDRERRRAEIAFRVASTLRSPQGRKVFTAVNSAGEAPIIVVLNDDPMAFLHERLSENGYLGNVIIPKDSGTLAVLSMSMQTSAPEGSIAPDSLIDCSAYSEVGMLLEAIEMSDKKQGLIRMTSRSFLIEETSSELLTTA